MQLLWKKFKRNQLEANIDECGIEIGAPNTGYHYKVTKCAVLHIVMSGKGTFVYDGQTHHLKQGDLFLLQRGMTVHYYASSDTPWIYYWVGFSGKVALEYLNRTRLVDTAVVQKCDTTSIAKIIERMCETAKNYSVKHSDDIRHMQDLYQLLHTLYRTFPKKFESQPKEMYTNVLEAIRYINRNYMHPITIAQVAQHVNVSRSYLYKLFKQNIDQSPKNYLIQLRMFQAAKLLRETSLQSQEIADKVGYKDPLMFSKAFKTFFGMNPTAYRQKHLKQTTYFDILH
ncbi:AraC family transcriptional regulator [Staphylococcus sp. 17KM0847]|uniref:AraC family transcriptional regulator n=1 Tax=Staphylococcus sp. 17KM0847 TaxID=2583989 RepID=UPI0015DCAD9C|nr:AraC family transcriptional regulator [Staphylococcus sp. 17KM0847]QLK86708.1 AraC family transcriptional regulator [Staphylococcus sp. 17KM0847]